MVTDNVFAIVLALVKGADIVVDPALRGQGIGRLLLDATLAALAATWLLLVLGATGSVLLLASNVHGSEHLRDLLVGQILWVDPSRLPLVAG